LPGRGPDHLVLQVIGDRVALAGLVPELQRRGFFRGRLFTYRRDQFCELNSATRFLKIYG